MTTTATSRRPRPLLSLPTFVTRVVEVTRRSPNLSEIVLEGGLDEFESRGRDQFVYVMVRRPGGSPVPVDHTMTAQLDGDPALAPIAAYYTVRSWDAERARLTLWIVRHGHEAGVGGWVDRCAIGERVAVWGPREGRRVDTAATSFLFVTDETGLGAVAAQLDDLPAGTPALAIVETVDPAHAVVLPARPGTDVLWLYRGDDAPGTGSRLLDAVRMLDLPTDGLFAFGAGEAEQMSGIRRYLRHDLGLAPLQVSMNAYWRRVPPD